MGTVLEILPASSTFSAARAIRKAQRIVRFALARVSAENLAAINTGIESNAAIEAAKKHVAANRTLMEKCARKTAQLRVSLESAVNSPRLPADREASARIVHAEVTPHTKQMTAQLAEVQAVMKQAAANIEQHLAEIESMRQRLMEPVRTRIQRNDSSVAEHV